MVYVIVVLGILTVLSLWRCLVLWRSNTALRTTLATRKETIETLKETNLLYEEAAHSWRDNFFTLAEKVGLDTQLTNQENNGVIKVDKNTLN